MVVLGWMCFLKTGDSVLGSGACSYIFEGSHTATLNCDHSQAKSRMGRKKRNRQAQGWEAPRDVLESYLMRREKLAGQCTRSGRADATRRRARWG